MWQYTYSFLGQSLDCSECYVDLDNVDDYNESEGTGMTKEQAELYVQTCFTEYLGREADPGALEAYSNAILDRDENDDLSDVDKALQSSDEYKRNFIIKCYQVHLGRNPESEEVIQAKMGYPKLRDIVNDIMQSEEYQNMHN